MSRRNSISARAVLCIAVVMLTGCTGSDSGVRDVEIEIVERTDSFEGRTFVSEHLRIELTDQKVIQAGATGNENGELPVLAIWYRVTNTSTHQTDALTSWFTHFQVRQNLSSDPNTAKPSSLSPAASPDERLTKHETDLIEEDVTQENVIAYQLLHAEAPVEISVTDTRLHELGRLRIDID